MRPWRKEQRHAPLPPGQTWDPFAAAPLIAEDVEVRVDSQGLFQVRKTPPPKRSLASSLAQRLGLQRHVRVNLDAYGTLFWRQIDGRHTLRDIERLIRQQTQQNAKESEKATILFTKMLMLRRLIHLMMPKQGEDGA